MSKAKLYLQYENQNLVLGPQKKDLRALTRDYERPAYVYDLDILKERFALFKKALPGVQVYYAMKANSHPKILQCLREQGCGLTSSVGVKSVGPKSQDFALKT